MALPCGVFSHGFVNAADGRKMSKSYNNAIDPHEVRADTFYLPVTTPSGMLSCIVLIGD